MSQKKTLIVNLAASHVSISAFHVESSRLLLDKFYTEELAPGLSDEVWLSAALSVVGRLVKENKISGDVTVIVPSFLLLQKALKVAQVEAARQAQIVAFEAQNNIPYPLHEVVWDSQVISSDGVEAEVLLFALRIEVANNIANAILDMGLRPKVIQAASLLDARAVELHGGFSAEEILIINVGARTTDISFVGPAGSNLQSANIGGNILTQGIADSTGQPLAAAEVLKVACFNGKVRLPEGDPQAAIIRTNADSFNKRLAQDLNRRLINARRGALGRQPTRILITGRGAGVPRLAEQFTESLRLPVETFDPLSVITLGAGLNPEQMAECAHQISEVVGEAAKLVLPQLHGINLMPHDVVAQINFDSRKPFLAAAALLVALAPLPLWLALSEATQFNTKQTALWKAKSKELTGYQSSIADTKQEVNKLLATNKQLESVASNTQNWPLFLIDLQTRIAATKNTWVEDIRIKREGASSTPVESTENVSAEPATTATNVIKVIITARTILEKAAPESVNSQEGIARQNLLMANLKLSPFVEEIPTDEIKMDYKEPSVPKITCTLVIRKDKAL